MDYQGALIQFEHISSSLSTNTTIIRLNKQIQPGQTMAPLSASTTSMTLVPVGPVVTSAPTSAR